MLLYHDHFEGFADDVLVEHIQHGCEECFGLLFHRYFRQVFAVAFKIVQRSIRTPFKSRGFNEAAKGPQGLNVMVDDVTVGCGRVGSSQCAVSVAAALSVDWSILLFLHTMNKTASDIAGVTRWQDPQAYIELSAIYHLNQVTTPMLL